jgi:carbonic anhydrase
MISQRSVLFGAPAVATATLVGPSIFAKASRASPPQQSPIDIVRATAVPTPLLPQLLVNYPSEVELPVKYLRRDADDPAGCTTCGREETIEAEVPTGVAWVNLGTIRYDLVQFHFHTLSEHTLDGRRFPIEQHFVHRGPNGETLVIGLFLVPGEPDDDEDERGSVQDQVLSRIPVECGEETLIGRAGLRSALRRSPATFRYQGSLTVGPNSEGVSWLVVDRPKQILGTSVTSVQRVFPGGNVRDLQPLNGRVVAFR